MSTANETTDLQAFLDAAVWTPESDKRPAGRLAAVGGVVGLAVVTAGLLTLLVIPYAVVTADVLSQIDGSQINLEAFWALFKK